MRSQSVQTTPLSTNEPPFVLERYRSGDEKELLTLFEQVFGSRRVPEHWSWQFGRNPYDSPRAVLARETSPPRRLVGQYTVMPVRLNVMGREVKGAQSLDTMVHPEFRGNGIFEVSARECFEQLKADGYALVYGFPNQSSFPGFVRKLGWHRIAHMVRYSRRLSLTGALQRRLKMPLIPRLIGSIWGRILRARLAVRGFRLARRFSAYRFAEASAVPESYDELWDAVRSHEVLSIWKDAGYFRWRYDENPSHRFTYGFLEKEGKLEALAVSVRRDDSVEILELVVRDRNADLARHLVDRITAAAMSRGAERLSFTGSSLDFFDEVFRGFERRVDFSHVFCLGLLTDGVAPLVATNPHNWTVTQGDSDAY